MASKRKFMSDDNASVSPPTKSAKKDITRSGRVRKKPSKFSEDTVQDDVDVSKPPAPTPPSSVPQPAAVVKVLQFPKPSNKPPTPAEPPVVVMKDTAPVPEVASPTDDSSKTSGRMGRMRKKSAKVLEMEEFEEAEKKTTKKSTASTDAARKSAGHTPDASRPTTAHTSPVAATSPQKKSQKHVEVYSPPANIAITSKLLLASPPSAIKVKDIAKSPIQESMLLVSPHTSPKVLGTAEQPVSPRAGKGSVIKLLLSSPAQAVSPIVSTSAFLQGSAASADKVTVSTKKKSKAKSKTKMSPEIAATEVINLDSEEDSQPFKQPLSKLKLSPEQLIMSRELSAVEPMSVDTGVIKSIRPLSNEASDGLKMKIMLSSPPQAATQKKLLTQALTSPVKEQVVTAKAAVKEAKSKKSKKSAQLDKEATFLVPGLTAPSSVVHVPIDISNIGIKAASEAPVLVSGGRKAGKSHVNAEMEAPIMDDEFGLDLPEITLGGPGDDSLMQMDDDHSLLYASEKIVESSKEKPVKKKMKMKAGGKKGAIRLGDVPATGNTGVGSQLVMDLDKMKPDEKKKKKKVKEPPEPDKNKKKRAPTAYMLWCTSHRTKVVQDNPGIDFSTVSKTLGEMWSGLPEKEKMMWKRKAKKAAGKGSTLITTGKAQQAAKQAAVSHATPKHAVTARSAPALTAAILANAAKTSVDEAVLSPTKGFGIEPIDAAAHLKILGESLGIIGMKLQEHRGMIAVQGSLSVLLDTILCSLGPLMCLTTQVPETDGCPHDTHMKTLDNIAYFMPGL